MDPTLTDFYLNAAEPIKSCLQSLRDIVLKSDPDIRETRKYGMPCYTYRDKALCYIWTDKKSGHPYLLIVDGNKIDHPALVKGDRARMKVLPIDPNENMDLDIILEILKLAKSFSG